MKNKNIITGIVTLVVIVAAFFAGKSYGASHPSAATTAANGQHYRAGMAGGTGNFGGRGGMGGATMGTVVSKDANSITVSIPSGGSKIILYSPTTTISKSAQGSINDIATGATITAIGTANADGSTTATAIQIRPQAPAPQQ